MFALRSLHRFPGAIRSSSVLSHAVKSISCASGLQSLRFNTTSTKSPVFSVENRDTGKHIWARKTFLVDYYKYLNDSNEIVLYVHHNNLVRADNKRFRSELKKAGAQLTIIRNSIYSVYLRSEHEKDPADRETSARNKDVVHPLTPLLNGPTGIITIPQCDPSVVSQTLKILKSAQEKIILIGAKIESKVFDIDEINQFKDLPNKDQLQGQLAGLLTILGGAGLVRTLESPGTALYLTMDQRKQDMDPESKDSL
ncbi:54S ribosomal protein L11 mitochondrial [Meyerozyma sp. JA9]|nr:54S ribosomal protein L11 mitochondrial [Meyerozyma sp. JA9]